MKNQIVSIQNCSYHISLEGKLIQILKDISFDIFENSITLITGRSGSGKTTLIHCIAGLIVPQKGSINFESSDLCQMNHNKRAKYRLENTGIVYQSFNFLPSLTIEENIVLPAIMAKQPRDQYIKNCNQLCQELGIENQQNLLPQSVSGGELQRAALVRALINQPKIIFADEPTGNLDTSNRDIILNTFKKIKNEKELSIVFTSHDPIAYEIADRVVELGDGKLLSVK